MTPRPSRNAAGFHDGELTVQRDAGVRAEADRLVGMLAQPDLRGGVSRFLTDRAYAALTARDDSGGLWVTALVGAPGFLDVRDATTLRIHAAPRAGDPLHRPAVGQPVGLLAIEFATRRRVRVNGTLTGATGTGLVIEVDEAFGNCPQYIQQRTLRPRTDDDGRGAVRPRRSDALTTTDRELIARADTFVLGTTHPQRGNDASHRGGPPGFVRVERHTDEHHPDGTTLWWPDYPGNNMFNSLGNLVVDDTAALLFADFTTGDTLHLSGTARLDRTAPGTAGDDGRTGRRVLFRLDRVVACRHLALRADAVVPYARNPALTDEPPAVGAGTTSDGRR